MITRILLAVDDSPASMQATRAALELAASLRARLRVVNVIGDHRLVQTLERASGTDDVRRRREVAAASLLDRVAALAHAAGVQVETRRMEGEPARCILAEAAGWPADLIVIAKSDQHRRAGEPYVGTETANVLEFAEQPVLVTSPVVGRYPPASPDR